MTTRGRRKKSSPAPSAQFQDRIDESSRGRDDLDNLIASSDIATKERERELRATREQVSADLARMTRLHQLNTVLSGTGDLPALLQEILRATTEITGAQMGAVHLNDGAAGLTLVAHLGISQPFVSALDHVHAEAGSVCAVALKRQQRVVVEDVATNPDFTGSPSLDLLITAGVRGVQSTPLTDRAGRLIGMMTTHYATPHQFTEAELRWVDLLARDAADLIERRHIEQSLARAQAALEQRIADQTKWLQLMRDVSHAINDSPTWEDALHRVLERFCEAEHWQMGSVYLLQNETADVITLAIGCVRDTTLRPFHEASAAQHFARGDESLPGRVYADGQPIWVDDQQTLRTLMPKRATALEQTSLRSAALLPITLGRDVIGVLELLSTESHPASEPLMILMQDVNLQIARILEWERSTAQMADLVWREQQGLLHTLHDSLGQTLTGLGMLSSGLSQQLSGTNRAAAATAQQVAQQAQIALEQVRQLARGFPVDVEAKDLMPELRELASTTESLHKIQVRVAGSGRQLVGGTRVATQLYRIAQEAVTNAVKHARPTAIAIELAVASGLATLRIIDNGVGFQDTHGREAGLGIRIMRYRSTSIGAHLSIEPGPDGGTIVTCTMTEKGTSAVRLAGRRSKPGASHTVR